MCNYVESTPIICVVSISCVTVANKLIFKNSDHMLLGLLLT